MIRRLIALVLIVLSFSGCATTAGPAKPGPGSITKSSPFDWKHRCATECKWCSPEEREQFDVLRGFMCPEGQR